MSFSLLLFFKQLRALLWKSFIIRRVHFISTFFELLGPLVLILATAILYQNFETGPPGDKASKNESEFKGPIIYGDLFTIHFDPNKDFRSYQYDYHIPDVKTIFYAPEVPEWTSKLFKYFTPLNPKPENFTTIQIVPYKTESELNSALSDHLPTNYTAANHTYHRKRDDLLGIFFTNTQEAIETGSISFKLRILGRSKVMEMTQALFPLKYTEEPLFSSLSGALHDTDVMEPNRKLGTINAYISRAFIEMLCLNISKTDCSASFRPITTKLMPYPKYQNPTLSFFSIHDVLSIVLPLSYVVLVPLIVKRITDEKCTKAKEMMRLIGMSDLVFWCSHFLNYLAIVVVHAAVVTMLMWIFRISVFKLSSPVLFGVGFLMYGVQMILFSMLVTTVFNRPVIATIVTTILWLLLSVVIFYNLIPSIQKSINISATNPARIATCFLPSGSIIWFVSIMGTFESNGVGLSWGNLGERTRIYGSFTEAHVLLCMLASYFIYGFLIWYLDSVWPFQHGVPKSPIFFCKPSYWCLGENGSFSGQTDDHVAGLDPGIFEPEPKDLQASIRIENLVKVFTKMGEGTKTAVDHLWLNIYENQITVLLGHNGAGKSTTMNMITGMFKSTSGTVYVNGHNVFTQTSAARRSIGLCPQENIIFNELTVSQHLVLFAMLKDYPASRIVQEVANILDLLKLTDKKNVLATKLSGGMKRKLSLGIALVGGTETLILDEPTSGMDPDARRVIWDLLISIRRQRTILLTTHYMEEADVLGDRIAIMNDGKLCCSGTPFFLKSAFGTGYRLRIAKQPTFNSTQFQTILRRYIASASLSTEIETEVIYTLDDDGGQRDKKSMMAVLPQMFDDIERHKQKYGIDSCGLSYATLEDVFLTVGSDVNLHSNAQDLLDHHSTDSEDSGIFLTAPQQLLDGPSLLLNQIFGLFLKRLHFTRRYWPMAIFQLVIPSVIIIAAMFIQRIGSAISSVRESSMTLNTKNLYGPGTESFVYGDQFLTGNYQSLMTGRYSAHVSQITVANDSAVDSWILDQVKSTSLNTYIQKYLYGFGFEATFFSTWFNAEQYHSLTLSLNVLFETLLRSHLPRFNSTGTITVESVPMRDYDDTQSLQFIAATVSWVLVCLVFLPIAFPFLAASYILYPIREHTSKSKLLQLMAGLSPVTFWITNFLFDLLNHLIAITVLYGIIYFLDTDKVFFGGTHGSSSASILYLLLLSFGISTIPMVYVLSYFFSKPSSGFVFLLIIFFLVGFICNIVFSILDFLITYLKMRSLSPFWFNFSLYIFRLIPIFSMLFGYQKVQKLSIMTTLCTEAKFNCTDPNIKEQMKVEILYGCCTQTCSDMCYFEENPFSFGKAGSGVEVAYMLVTGLLCFTLIVLFEAFKQQFATISAFFSLSRLFQKQIPISSNGHTNGIALVSTDSDVEMERIRIEDEVRRKRGTFNDLLTVGKLTKRFSAFTAVDELSFGVHYNECFGLLGVNGAGKTTTFSMLTGDLLPTTGNAYAQKGAFSLIEDMRCFQRQIGYCPQFDALLDKLTGEETLYLFARLRGVPRANLSRDVRNLIKMVGLEAHAKKQTEHYSGGNRRKLSIAISLVGNPPLLLLDEPSAGVDPAARRKIWQTLGYLKRHFNSSIVLTSHSMEECEALCSRIGIMVGGKLRCLGSTQHLRSKYGQGYSLTLSLHREHESDLDYIASIQAEVSGLLPSSVLKDYHQSLMHYHLTDSTVQWSHIFKQLYALNEKYHFEDYFVSDTTLEQIFIMFARH